MSQKKCMVLGLFAVLLLASGSAAAICKDDFESWETPVPAMTPSEDFYIHGDGTVTHIPTGLMWKRCSEGQNWDGSSCTGSASMFPWGQRNSGYPFYIDYPGALDHADGHSFAGHSDWRLPNVKELNTITEIRCSSPSINTVIFPGTPSERFWSSSPQAEHNWWAWQVSFGHGVHSSATTKSCSECGAAVRLVRDAQ